MVDWPREEKGWQFDPSRVAVHRRRLLTGDYTLLGLEDRVCLERKTLGDFVQTVIHEWIRFRKELNRLSGMDVAAVVVEADLGQVYRHEYQSQALPASILGKANGIFLDHGIPVLWWQDKLVAQDMACRFLALAWKKFHEPAGSL